MSNSAPVEEIGGAQDAGPWPDGLDEVTEGEKYNRPVRLPDGSVQDLDVLITGVNDILDDDGTPTGGHAISFQFDDPTISGGGI